MAVLSIPEASIKVLGLYDNSGTLFGWLWVKKQTDINNQMSQNDDKSMDGIVRISYRPLWVVLKNHVKERLTREKWNQYCFSCKNLVKVKKTYYRCVSKSL